MFWIVQVTSNILLNTPFIDLIRLPLDDVILPLWYDIISLLFHSPVKVALSFSIWWVMDSSNGVMWTIHIYSSYISSQRSVTSSKLSKVSPPSFRLSHHYHEEKEIKKRIWWKREIRIEPVMSEDDRKQSKSQSRTNKSSTTLRFDSSTREWILLLWFSLSYHFQPPHQPCHSQYQPRCVSDVNYLSSPKTHHQE